MHIVFWSCMPGHAAVSSSMLSIACDCAGYQKSFTGILQTQYKKNNLQYPFFNLASKNETAAVSIPPEIEPPRTARIMTVKLTTIIYFKVFHCLLNR